jgi:hypothetical protein
MAAAAREDDKVSALPAGAGAGLSGKVLAVTRHAKADFNAMTAGKGGLGMFGALAGISAGNKIVEENRVADPADILEAELAPAVAKHFGMTLKAGGLLVDGNKPKKIVAAQPDSDFILDLQTRGWSFSYHSTDRDSYWVGYLVQARLFDTRSGKELSKMNCYSDTMDHPESPGKDDLLANQAQLLKDLTASLGWLCLHRVAKQQFALADGQLPAVPAALVDPLTSR